MIGYICCMFIVSFMWCVFWWKGRSSIFQRRYSIRRSFSTIIPPEMKIITVIVLTWRKLSTSLISNKYLVHIYENLIPILTAFGIGFFPDGFLIFILLMFKIGFSITFAANVCFAYQTLRSIFPCSWWFDIFLRILIVIIWRFRADWIVPWQCFMSITNLVLSRNGPKIIFLLFQRWREF